MPVTILDILTNPGDQVVLNVDTLRLGNCSKVTWPNDAIVNVPGRGAPVKVGLLSRLPVLLAPERTTSVLGAADDFTARFSTIYTRTLKTKGFIDVDDDRPCY